MTSISELINSSVSHALIVISLVSFLVSSFLYIHSFPKSNKRENHFLLGFGFFIVGTISTCLAIATSLVVGFYTGMSGLVLIASISWLTVLGFFLFKMRILGIITAPLSCLIILYQMFTVPLAEGHIASTPPLFLPTVHISLAILGEAFAICAFGVSALYLLQHRALKKKQLYLISPVTPPLDKLDRLLVFTLWVGFIFISLGLVSGGILTRFFPSPHAEMSLGWKIIWATLVWAWYLAILLARNIFAVSGKHLAQMSVAGFLLLSAFFFGLL
ncbi:MAG: cytochrome c biogenesis protein CcsA [Oligoflexales bacterium]